MGLGGRVEGALLPGDRGEQVGIEAAIGRVTLDQRPVVVGLAEGEWWRLLTAAFLHYGPIHLGMNMLALWWVGRPLEGYLGSLRYLLLYLVGGLACVALVAGVGFLATRGNGTRTDGGQAGAGDQGEIGGEGPGDLAGREDAPADGVCHVRTLTARSNDMVVIRGYSGRRTAVKPPHGRRGDQMSAERSHQDATPAAPGDLSERDRAILEFERQWWKYAGAKESAVREQFDMSATRYYQVLNALIDRPEALAADPLLVRRLRRLRSQRQRQRSARRLGFEI